MRTIFFLGFLLTISLLYSQKSSSVTYDHALLLTPTYTFQIPGGELAQRFGVNSNFGFECTYKFGKNLYVGVEGNFLWGKKVKEYDFLSDISIQNSYVINTDGGLEEINLSQRGAQARFIFGKSFYFNESKPNNGILLKAGIGYLSHKILIDVDIERSPQLSKEMQTGYDHFTHGASFSQFIGLMKLEQRKFVNLYFGVELIESITKYGRPWDFYSNSKPDGIRYDMYYGLKLGWIIPIFNGQSGAEKEEFYY